MCVWLFVVVFCFLFRFQIIGLAFKNKRNSELNVKNQCEFPQFLGGDIQKRHGGDQSPYTVR
jgi:hypothetical protein